MAKGKIFDDAVELFERAGVRVPEELRASRKLTATDAASGRTFMVVRAQDVLTYVTQGAADAGVVGRDVLLEQGSELYQMLDLGIAPCRLVLAAKDPSVLSGSGTIRVATKYPNLARGFFLKKNRTCSIIKLYGSVELAPIVNLADAIVDLVSTGQTLKENGLTVLEDILPSTALLVVNRVSLKMQKRGVDDLISAIKPVLAKAS